MLNRILKRRSRHHRGAMTPVRADLQIRNLLDSPELQAVMESSAEVDERGHDTPVTPVRRIEQHRRATADLFDVAA